MKIILDNRGRAQVLKALVRICILHSKYIIMQGAVNAEFSSFEKVLPVNKINASYFTTNIG